MAKETQSVAAEIQSVIDAWAQGIRAKDATAVVAHQAKDFVQYDLAPPLRVVGSDPHGMKDWFATWQGEIGYEMKDLHVTGGDDVAFCYGLVNLTGKRTDGSDTNV